MGQQSGNASSGEAAGSLLPSNLVELEKQVKAAESIWNTIDAAGFRSIKGEIVNLSSKTLTMFDEMHHEGGWTASQPELFIPPRSTMLFGSRNKAPLKGTKGYLGFRSDDGVVLHCSWSNPFGGNGSISFTIEGLNESRYGARALCSTGNTDSRRRWIFFPRVDLQEQDQWRACASCQTLFFAGDVHNHGACARPPRAEEIVPQLVPYEPTRDPLRIEAWPPGGGMLRPQPTPPSPPPSPRGTRLLPHNVGGSFNYILQHSAPPLDHEEAAWRQCMKCLSLYHTNFDRPSRCGAGGTHQHAPTGFEFLILHDAEPPQLPAQGGWRVCSYCHGLFFEASAGQQGYCPSRRDNQGHEAYGDTIYSLRHR